MNKELNFLQKKNKELNWVLSFEHMHFNKSYIQPNKLEYEANFIHFI